MHFIKLEEEIHYQWVSNFISSSRNSKHKANRFNVTMGFKHQSYRFSSASFNFLSIKSSTIFTIILIFSSFVYFFTPLRYSQEPFLNANEAQVFKGDLRDARFPWNKLCFGPPSEKLKLAVFSKTWPVGEFRIFSS